MGMEPAIHWFRRDLRLIDNRAAARAGQGGRPVIGLFVLDPAILGNLRTGPSRVAHLLGALAALDASIRRLGSNLVVRSGNPLEVVPAVAEEVGASLVTAVRSFEPYSRARDDALSQRLQADGRELWLSAEQLLLDPLHLPPLRTFSACRRRFQSALAEGIPGPTRPPTFLPVPALPRTEPLTAQGRGPSPAPEGSSPPGEQAAGRRLAAFISSRLERYAATRDDIAGDGTSNLSTDLHFGSLSVRTAIRAALEAARDAPELAGGADRWLEQLAWRDFFGGALWHFAKLTTQEHRAEFRHLEWRGSEYALEAWRQGATGYPIVDAAMRQLRADHLIHNRCRMIVASFLVKDLHLDWRHGEAHFARELLDADLANNNGGWQWIAGTGLDAQPYFRILNPTVQGERYDPNGAYVRRWLPELRYLPDRYVHRPWDAPSPPRGYPRRIVDHAAERLVALELYRACSSQRSDSSSRPLEATPG